MDIKVGVGAGDSHREIVETERKAAGAAGAPAATDAEAEDERGGKLGDESTEDNFNIFADYQH